ncbi:hypothetical protein [Yoonia vestfoldensis]|uniref:hypothetical protein n=1 Tax=Yoonia vestfoldensis TaxID=245188 RepID=UPI00037CA4F9|nr:hypothetical protein [Yoonia vestfoldensis]
MTRLQAISAAVALLCALPVSAKADTTLAHCSPDWDGAVFHTVSVEPDEIAFTIGRDLAPPPFPDAILIMRDNGAPVWSYDDARSIHATCGGEGEPILDLFGPDRARNGSWRADITDMTMEGCPPAVSGAIGAAGASNTTQIVWPTPFSPAPLMGGHGTWRQTGLSRWRGVIMHDANDFALGRVSVSMRVLSDTEIRGTQFMTIILSPAIAGMIGMGDQCRVVTTTTYRWQG